MSRILNFLTCAFEFVFLFYVPFISNGHCSAIGCQHDSVTMLLFSSHTYMRSAAVHSPGFITVIYDVDIWEGLNTC